MSELPVVRRVAEEIVNAVISERGDEAQQLAGAEQILGALQDELIRLIGPTGFHALLDRAFQRAATQVGGHVRSRPLQRSTDARNFTDDIHSIGDDTIGALIAVMAELLSLLTRLIGADITTGLVQRAWPGVATWLTAAHLEDSDG